jgi:hypothetical protein
MNMGRFEHVSQPVPEAQSHVSPLEIAPIHMNLVVWEDGVRGHLLVAHLATDSRREELWLAMPGLAREG